MTTLQRLFVLVLILSFILSACGAPATPQPADMSPTSSPSTPRPAAPAFKTGVYPNLFAEYLGKSDAEIQAKIDQAFQQLFYGDDQSERVYYPVGADMAYILDTGNDDVRSEGMSYGMMIAVQMNKKEEFDRLWKWAKTYMYQKDGGYKGYFAWHCKPDGTQLAANPASDGEIWFVMALFFADGRWGSGEGIYNYRAEAQAILDTALSAEGRGDLATDLFDPVTKQVVFVPQIGRNAQFTDPSYHMPHYYELWARWANKNNDFWAQAAQASRAYLPKAVHPQTGLAPDYAEFDGRPVNDRNHGNFRYDAFRVGANVGVDYAWFAPGDWHREQSNRLLSFFASQGMDEYKAEYLLDGTPDAGHRSTGLMATNAVAALAADREIGEPFVQALWNLDVPTGKYRYYDGLLMMLALLQVSGNFRIYEPGSAPAGQVFPTPQPEVSGKFAPANGRALLLVGPSAQAVDAYFDATVTAPGGVAVPLDVTSGNLDEVDALARKYPNSVLSVAVDVGALPNLTDPQMDSLLAALNAYARPVFLRLRFGPETPPETTLSAWRRLQERMQAAGGANIAQVWEPASCTASDLEAAYPGDEGVDWVGTGDDCAEVTLPFARQHLKPVVLVAAPAGANWETGYAPFFAFVADNADVVRMVIYLYDGQLSGDTLKQWKSETQKPFWLRASPRLFDELRFVR